MNELAFWVHDLDPVLFQINETLAIRWYGLAYLAGFLTAYGLLKYYYRKGLSPLGPERLETLMFGMILGVVLGGRLGYMFLYDLEAFLSNPLILFRVWEGGMASHGGFMGVVIATLLLCRKWQISALRVGDLIATLTAPGLFFGRIANFINGELWGKVSDASWAVIFPASARAGTPVELIEPRHPSQLYQAGLEGLLLFVYIQIRFWKGSARLRPGQLTGEFFVAYALLRIVGELFREPDASLILGMSRGSFYSLILIITGVGFIIFSIRNDKKIEKPVSMA